MNRIHLGVQKTLATLTMAATVLSLGAFAALPTVASAVAPADYGLHEGDVIRATGDIDLYIINDAGYKRLFVNPAIFNLYGHLSWNNVKEVAPSTRDAFVTSGLFRNCESGDQKVYGLDVISEDVANLRWVNTTGAQAVADDPNFFAKVFCINTAEQHLYGTGADFTSVSQVPNYSRGTTTVPNGNVSVSLASDNPASSSIIAGQAAADLAHFSFTGSGAVTSVKLMRNGVSSDTVLSNVYLYQGNKRLTDAATVSQGVITFSDTSGLFTVSGQATISVKGDVDSTATGGTIGVSLTGVNGNAVSLSGNLMNIIAAPGDFGTVSVGSPTPSGDAITLDPQNDYVAWQSTLTVGNHDAWLKSLQLRVIGSVLPGDLRNFRLYVDGVAVGSAVAQTDSNGYVIFDLGSNPIKLITGSRTLKLLVDVVGGSSKNFYVSLRQKPDLQVIESQYNQPILSGGTFPAAAPLQDGILSDVQTINAGSLTITKTSDSPSGDIIKDSAGSTFSRYEFKAFGEAMKVENLRLTFTASNNATLGALRNGAIYVDGSQVGSIQSIWEDSTTTASHSTAYTEFNLGSSLIVQPGTPRTVEIRADVFDANGTNNITAGDTLTATIAAGSSNVQRLTSLNYISAPSATTVPGNQLTVKTGSFTAAKYTGYANQSVVAPQSQYKVGHYTLTAASSEDINVNTVNLDFQIASASSFTASDLTNVYLKVWNDVGGVVLQTTPKSTVSSSASNSYSTNFTIPKNKTYQVEVYADVGSSIDTDQLVSNLDASGTTTSSNTTVTAAEVQGQLLTGASGALTLANASVPVNRIVNGSQTVTAYSFTLQPQYDNFYLDDATFRLSPGTSNVASSSGAVGMLYLKDGSTVIGSTPITTLASMAFSLTGMNYPVPQSGSTKTLTVDVQLNNVGVGANDTAGLVLVQLSHLKYRDSNGNITTSVVTPASFQGNSNYVVKAFPTFTNQSLPSSVLTPGSVTLFKTSVSAAGGQVVWRDIKFTIASSSTSSFSVGTFKLYEDGVDTGLTATASLAVSPRQVEFHSTVDRTVPSGGSRTLELRATITGSVTSGSTVTTQIANPSSSTVTTEDLVTQETTAASFIWSDSSAPSHNATTTDDWFTDGLVKDLAQSQSLFQ